MNQGYTWDFSLIWQYQHLFVEAIGVSALIAVLSIVFGATFGLLLAVLAEGRWKPVSIVLHGFVEIVRAVPPLVIIVWLYYCLPILFDLKVPAFQTTVIALSVYSAAFFAEIFRGGIQSINHGHIEAGLSVGMTRYEIFKRIVGPLAFQQILPPLINQCVLVIKNTSLAGYIAVNDILYVGQRLSNATFRPIEVLTIVALIYIAMIVPLSTAARIYEARMRRKYAR